MAVTANNGGSHGKSPGCNEGFLRKDAWKHSMLPHVAYGRALPQMHGLLPCWRLNLNGVCLILLLIFCLFGGMVLFEGGVVFHSGGVGWE